MMNTSTLRTIGKILRPHGLQGEVCVKPCDEAARWPGKLSQVYVFRNKGPQELQILSARWQKDILILKLKNITNRDEAEQLKGYDIKAQEEYLPEPEQDEYYADTLIGLTVRSQDSKQQLGVVKDLLSSDAGDFLEVEAENQTEPVLIPFQETFVSLVDTDEKVIWITGLDSLFTVS